MRDADSEFSCNQGTAHGGIHIAHDDNEVRIALSQEALESNHHAGVLLGMRATGNSEVHIWLTQPEVKKMNVAHCGIRVLTRMDEHWLHVGVGCPGSHQWSHLHEVRPCSNYIDNSHSIT